MYGSERLVPPLPPEAADSPLCSQTAHFGPGDAAYCRDNRQRDRQLDRQTNGRIDTHIHRHTFVHTHTHRHTDGANGSVVSCGLRPRTAAQRASLYHPDEKCLNVFRHI